MSGKIGYLNYITYGKLIWNLLLLCHRGPGAIETSICWTPSEVLTRNCRCLPTCLIAILQWQYVNETMQFAEEVSSLLNSEPWPDKYCSIFAIFTEGRCIHISSKFPDNELGQWSSTWL